MTIGIVDLRAKRELLERLLRAADEDGQKVLVMLLCSIDEDLLRADRILKEQANREASGVRPDLTRDPVHDELHLTRWRIPAVR